MRRFAKTEQKRYSPPKTLSTTAFARRVMRQVIVEEFPCVVAVSSDLRHRRENTARAGKLIGRLPPHQNEAVCVPSSR